MNDRQRPASTRAQIVTATFAALCAVVLLVGSFAAALVVYIAFQLVSGVGAAVEDTGDALAVPSAEGVCLNYAATVLELEAAGLDHDAIVAVIESAVQGEDTTSSELDELRELSLANDATCGPVRDVLDAAGR